MELDHQKKGEYKWKIWKLIIKTGNH